MFRRLSPVLLAALLASGTAEARPVVVELFTSEGCSSCPPADALLTELAKRSDLLPLAFHVTYWNYLGWQDPFSMQAATDRQAAYSGQLGGGAYTPEMVVDGRKGMVGSQRDEVAAAITTAQGHAAAEPAIRVRRSGGKVSIAIPAGRGKGRVVLIGYDPVHRTPVGRGENTGRTLTESNIVRSMRVVGQYDGAALDLAAEPGAGLASAVIIEGAGGGIIGSGRS